MLKENVLGMFNILSAGRAFRGWVWSAVSTSVKKLDMIPVHSKGNKADISSD